MTGLPGRTNLWSVAEYRQQAGQSQPPIKFDPVRYAQLEAECRKRGWIK